MIAGLPGVGLGGIFYVFCALLMPLVELARMALGRERGLGWGVIGRQWLIACGSLGAIWATGWLLGTLVLMVPAAVVGDESAGGGESALGTAGAVYGVPSAAAGLLTVALLVLVLVGIQVLRLVPARPARAGASIRSLGPKVNSQQFAGAEAEETQRAA